MDGTKDCMKEGLYEGTKDYMNKVTKESKGRKERREIKEGSKGRKKRKEVKEGSKERK